VLDKKKYVMSFTLVERLCENIFINGDNSHLKGVLGRGEKEKREIRVLISLFPFSPLPSKG
jgi:hypothetical protein